MKRLFLLNTARKTSHNPFSHANLETIRASIELNPDHYQSCCHPELSDKILVCGTGTRFYTDLLKSQLFRQFSRRLFVIDQSDMPIPFIRGLYMTIPGFLNHRIFKYGFYLRVSRNPALRPRVGVRPRYLGSFQGNVNTNPRLRSAIIAITDDRLMLRHNVTANTCLEQEYIDTLIDSKFVICPRGYGASTIRVFEAMRLGRAPVIISDDWREPTGLPWADFSLRLPENQVHLLPLLLRSNEDRWKEMGATARQQWKQNFSTERMIFWIDRLTDEIDSFSANQPFFAGTFCILTALRQGLFLDYGKERVREFIGAKSVFQEDPKKWA